MGNDVQDKFLGYTKKFAYSHIQSQSEKSYPPINDLKASLKEKGQQFGISEYDIVSLMNLKASNVAEAKTLIKGLEMVDDHKVQEFLDEIGKYQSDPTTTAR
eukprot:TRINITY_DN280_c0_g1_i2.p1 TRINITY_DN280_c0_g1~~TRINITY_DN280_c0_g1_i2.p1  ORF type:complete len:115 (+),score=44.76 TRINITY_DN280_c0_g1_i2:40-345(+)